MSPCSEAYVCKGTDSPFANLSCEGPDTLRWYSVWYSSGQGPLGGYWARYGCIGLCESDVSQDEADVCAIAQGDDCLWGSPFAFEPWGIPSWPPWEINPFNVSTTEVPYDNPGPLPVTRPNIAAHGTVYGNTSQTCTVACYGGSRPVSYTVAANSFYGRNQAEADARAYSYACYRANKLRVCASTSITGVAEITLSATGTLTPTGTVPEEWWMFEEVAGNRIGGLHGTVLSVNAATIAPTVGKYGQGVEFSPLDGGSNNAPYLAGSGVFLGYSGTGFAVQGWMKWTRYHADSITTVFQMNLGSQYTALRALFDGSAKLQLETTWPPPGGYPVEAAFSPSLGTWYHFALNYDQATGLFELWLDGVLADSSVAPQYLTYPEALGGFLIGSSGYESGNGSIVVFDEVGVFPHALTAPQVAYLYNGGAGRTLPITLP